MDSGSVGVQTGDAGLYAQFKALAVLLDGCEDGEWPGSALSDAHRRCDR
jgi:hypothetical protein